MLVTVSGIVGSGKSTTARQIVEFVRTAGCDAEVLAFQSLPCFSWLRSPMARNIRRDPPRDPEPHQHVVRWPTYEPRRLGAAQTAVYLSRIVAFRVYAARWKSRARWYVVNRYFYDLFVHYRLENTPERVLLSVLAASIPRPDLAFLTVAQDSTIAERRPLYSAEYLSRVSQAYARLPERFPELIELRTDTETPAIRQAAGHIGAALATTRRS